MNQSGSAHTRIKAFWRQYADLPRAVHILCLGTFINRAGAFVLPFMALYLNENAELGEQFAGMAIGAFGAGSLAASLVGGHLADRIGRRIVMMGSLIGGAVILLVFGSLTSRASIMIGLFGFAFVADMYRPAASAMISDLVEPDRRPNAFGLMYVAINLGFGVGPMIGGVVSQYSFQWLFWGDALTTSIYAAIILFWIRETLPSASRRHVDSSRLRTGGDSPGGPAPHETPKRTGRFEALLHMLGNRPFVIFCLSMTLIGMVFHQSVTTFPIYLIDLGYTTKDYGFIIAINGILITVGQLPLTAMLTRFNRAIVIVIGALLTAIGFGVIGFAGTKFQFAGTVIIWTLGEMMQSPFSHSIVGDLAPVRFRARYYGFFMMSFSLSLMIGPPIGSLILEHYGPVVLWTACFFVGSAASLLILSIWRRIDGRLTPGAEIASES
ncbi:MAG: MFS transporter [Planctomycetota bacterium]|nr:MFS transporter [Planctomycetota bacterium]